MRRSLTALGALAAALAVTVGCSQSADFFWDGGAPDVRRPDQYPYWQDTGGGGPVPDGPVTPKDGPVTPKDGTTGDGPVGPQDKGPVPDKPFGGVLQAPFKLTFESDNGGLTGTRDWEWGSVSFKAGSNCDGTSQNPPKAGQSGTKMWGTKLSDCYSPLDNAESSGTAGACNNKTTSDDSVLTLKVSIPSWTYASLVFYEWADINFPYDWYEIRVNGTVMPAKSPYYSAGCRTSAGAFSWVKQRVVLDSYVGQTVTITFHFMATSVSQRAGWYLDDIAVENS